MPTSNISTLRRRSLLGHAAAALVAGASGSMAWAQGAAGDGRVTRLVVPFPAGGPTDALARLAADALAAPLGQRVVVDNKAGAGGGIAAELVARGPADGSTLLVAGQGLLFINKALYKKLAYDPDADFVYVGMLGSFPNVLVAHPEAVPVQSLAEMLALARSRPGQLSYGSNGIGSLVHLSTEVLASAAQVRFLHVPYQGAAPQMTDLLAGRIGFTLNGVQSVLPLVQQKKLRALAVSSATRIPELPDVPTLVESGFPALDLPVWFAVMAPAATPAPVLARLRAALATVTGAPAYLSELERRAAQPLRVPPEASAASFARERKLWSDAVRTTGATAE